ncbi:hypothetical protein GCK32_019722 [Trichostrongylus colubriformis]|uniref:Uncharacterized protein n=1 Tax=Trichostrongylus colubriformis TaxID=6319 RepID=A0AAN8IPC8_TRICO
MGTMPDFNSAKGTAWGEIINAVVPTCMLKELLLSTFKACLEIHACRSINVTFMCFGSAQPPDSDRQLAELNKRLKYVERSLKADRYLSGTRIVPPDLNCSPNGFQKYELRK